MLVVVLVPAPGRVRAESDRPPGRRSYDSRDPKAIESLVFGISTSTSTSSGSSSSTWTSTSSSSSSIGA